MPSPILPATAYYPGQEEKPTGSVMASSLFPESTVPTPAKPSPKPGAVFTTPMPGSIEAMKIQLADLQKQAEALNAKQNTSVTNTTDPSIRNPITGGLEDNPNYQSPSVVSSSDSVIQGEKDITSAIAGFKNPADPNSPIVDHSNDPSLKFLKDYQTTLEKRKADQIAQIEADYNSAKATTEKAQYAEMNVANNALQRIGGYTSPTLDTTGKLISLAQTHRAELESLLSKKKTAINEAENAINDKQFELAQKYYEGIKALDKEANDRKQKFFDNALALQKAQEAADKAKQDKIDKLNEIKKDAFAQGAGNDPIVKAALDAATTVGEAMDAAGLYLQTSTNPDLAKYLQYKRDVMAKGLIPESYDVYQAKQDAKASALKSAEAYNTAYGTAKGKAAAEAEAEAAANATLVATGNKELSGIIKTILASGKFTTEQAKQLRIGILRGEDPFTVVKNQAKNIMTGASATLLEKNEAAKASIENLQKNLTEYYAAGGSTNIFTGTMENTQNKLFGITGNPKLKTIATEIASALQIYRNAISGTAYSEQEGKDIASIFPGINKTEGLNNAVIAGRLNVLGTQIDTSYKNTIGTAYDLLKEKSIPADQKVDAYVKEVAASNPEIVQDAHAAYSVPGATDEKVLEYLQYKYPKTK